MHGRLVVLGLTVGVMVAGCSGSHNGKGKSVASTPSARVPSAVVSTPPASAPIDLWTASTWQRYTDKSGISFLLPSRPAIKSDSASTGEIRTYSAGNEAELSVFVMVYDLASPSVAEATLTSYVAQYKAKLQQQISGAPGEVTVTGGASGATGGGKYADLSVRLGASGGPTGTRALWLNRGLAWKSTVVVVQTSYAAPWQSIDLNRDRLIVLQDRLTSGIKLPKE